MAKSHTMIQNQVALVRNLKTQVGLVANEFKSWLQGTLPSDIEIPRWKGKEFYKLITRRRGNDLETPIGVEKLESAHFNSRQKGESVVTNWLESKICRKLWCSNSYSFATINFIVEKATSTIFYVISIQEILWCS